MIEKKDKEKNINDSKKNIPIHEELSSGYALTFKILLIIHIIILFAMFVFFGLNHLVLFTASTTIAIRMFLGVKNRRPNYFKKGLFFYIMCFVFHIIKIIFRFLITFFVYKFRDDIDNLKNMNIIETKKILWIKGFDIKLNGIWSIIVLSLCMIFWLILIILFESKKKCFNYVDNFEKEIYLNLINKYYEQHQLDDQQIQQVDVNNNNNLTVNGQI